MRARSIGYVGQSGDVHMVEAFAEEADVLGGNVGEIGGQGSCNVYVIYMLEGGAPATSNVYLIFHIRFMEIHDPGGGHTFHADVPRRKKIIAVAVF